MKKVKGFFVIVIKQFDTTMFDTDYHYTPWCIAFDKYCRSKHAEKMMKFNTYAEAEQYIKDTEIDTTHDRVLEIAYLTTLHTDDDSSDDTQLKNWIQIKGEEDAFSYDIEQRQGNHICQKLEEKVPSWDSNQFSSIYTNIESALELDSVKKVKGFFVIAVKQFDSTMFDANYHYTPWCIAFDKYCRSEDAEKMMKFNTYAEAEQYIKDTEIDTTHHRVLEIAYLTTLHTDDDSSDVTQLKNWIQIKGEEDAFNYDIKQASDRRARHNRRARQEKNEDTSYWDTSKFSSLYTENGPKLDSVKE